MIEQLKSHFDQAFSQSLYPVKDVSFAIFSKKIWNLAKEYLHSADKVVDFGCGAGILLYNLRKECKGEVLGIDSSQTACQMAKEFVPNVEIFCRNILNSRLEKNSFDMVASTMTIEHCDDAKFIKEVHRILKPGGKLLLTTVLKTKWAWYYLKNRKGERVLELSHIKEYGSIKELTRLLEDKGFEIMAVETPRFKVSPLDFFLVRIAAIFRNNFWRKLAPKPWFVYLRRITRFPVPGYHALELIAEKLT